MAKRPQHAHEHEEHDDGERSLPVTRVRRRIQVRSPEEMHGLTVSLLVPNAYLPHLLEAYIAGCKEGTLSRRGRKLPEAVMARQIFIRGLAEIANVSEEEVAEHMLEAEQNEGQSIAAHKARHAA